jgi:hypothetical protein
LIKGQSILRSQKKKNLCVNSPRNAEDVVETGGTFYNEKQLPNVRSPGEPGFMNQRASMEFSSASKPFYQTNFSGAGKHFQA